MSLYEGAVKKPIMTSLCFLAVAIFGLFSLSKLPVDLYPDIETNTIMESQPCLSFPTVFSGINLLSVIVVGFILT